MSISESSMMAACLIAGLLQCAATLTFSWKALRRKMRPSRGAWHSVSLVFELGPDDANAARTIRLLLSRFSGAEVEFLVRGPGTAEAGYGEAQEALRRLGDPRIRLLDYPREKPGLGSLSWALASVSQRSCVLLWSSLEECARPELLEERLKRLPTHAISGIDSMLRLTPIPGGLTGLLQLAGFIGSIPTAAVLAYLPDEPAAREASQAPVASLAQLSGLTAARNKLGLCARQAVCWLTALALVGLPAQAYFAFWALRPWPEVRWELLICVVIVSALHAVMFSILAAWILGAHADRILMWSAEKLDRDLRRRAEVMASQLERHVKRGVTVLDVGSGDGLALSRLLSSHAIIPQAIDIVPMTMGDVPVRAYDGVTIELADGAVDTSLCVCTLHHCADPSGTLKEIRRVTRGTFLLIEDAYDSPLIRLWAYGTHLLMQFTAGMPFNRDGFATQQQWRERLKDAGFLVLECRPFAYPVCRTPFFALDYPCHLFIAAVDARTA